MIKKNFHYDLFFIAMVTCSFVINAFLLEMFSIVHETKLKNQFSGVSSFLLILYCYHFLHLAIHESGARRVFFTQRFSDSALIAVDPILLNYI
jgi:hypothetical protein